MASFTAAAADNYRKAIDSYRSVAKWVVSSFGAIAAALVVGLPLTSLGELSGSSLVGAIACVAIVFLAILIVIRTASEVLEPLPPVDRTDLAKEDFPFFRPLHEFLADNQSMLGWDDVETAAELNTKYDRRWDAQVTAEATLATSQKEGSKKQIEDNQKAVDDATEAAEEVRERLDLLTTFGSALYMKTLYRQAMNKAYAAIAVSAALAICFACLSSSAADADSGKAATASTPAPIQVTVEGPRLPDWPRSCARLYFALDKLAAAEPRVGPLWPPRSFSPWDRKCGLSSRADVTRALEFLGRR